MRMRKEQGKRKTYGVPQRWTPRADHAPRPRSHPHDDGSRAERPRSSRSAHPVVLANRSSEGRDSARAERAPYDERPARRAGAPDSHVSPAPRRGSDGHRPRRAQDGSRSARRRSGEGVSHGGATQAESPRGYGAGPYGSAAYGSPAYPEAGSSPYAYGGSDPYAETRDPAPDRILPDVPRRPHRYTRPDLGPVPGARPHRTRKSRGPGHGRRLMFAGPARPRRSPAQVAAIALVALAVVFVGAQLTMGYLDGKRRAEEEAAAAAAQEAYEREQEELVQSFSPGSADLDAIPAAEDGVELFSLSGADAPALSDRETEALSKALAPVEDLGPVGFALINLETGYGLAYNVDEVVYGASSFKAPYATYVCQSLVDAGKLALDDVCSASASSSSVRDLIRAAVVDSDNDSFIVLRAAYDAQGFESWIEDLGIDDTAHAEGSFPSYCARSAAKLWMNTYAYFNGSSETARWLKDLCGQTTTSFLRDGISDKVVEVYDKAGWYTSDDAQYRCVSDSGLVEDADGTTYLMTIMTGMSYGDDAVAAFGTLADTLFATREALAS